MDKEQIAYRTHHIESSEDLLSLLNDIKYDHMVSKGMGNQFYPFTMRLLKYYCNPNNTRHRYKEFDIKKKSGGFRRITSPRNRSFMLMLDCVNEIFKSIYTPSPCVMGFVEGRSVVNNAAVHKGMNYVFNTDLKDFFPSVEQARIWKRIQLKPLNVKPSIASILAGMCCMKKVSEDGKKTYVLPQGAPTSPIITNMICDKLDRRLSGLAKRLGLKYSRYADDITFSSMHNVYQKNGIFLTELKRIITDQGFIINEKKTRLQKLGSRQEVTGVIVSKKLNVPQKYVRDIRNILYIWSRYGYSVASERFLSKYKSEKINKKGETSMIKVIGGKLMYLKMVKGENDSVYTRLNAKFKELSKNISDNETLTNHGIVYTETIPLKDFEKKTSTKVVIITKENKKDKETKPVTSRTAYFVIDGRKTNVSVNKSVSVEEEKNKDLLSISNCRDGEGKQFWLVHKSNKKIISKEEPQVDIDELNKDLDLLLQ